MATETRRQPESTVADLGGCAENGAEQVEPFRVSFGLGQMPAEQQRQDGEGDGGREHPGPGTEGEDEAAQRRRQRQPARNDDAVDAEPAPQLPGGIDGAKDRRGDAERRRRASDCAARTTSRKGRPFAKKHRMVAMVKTIWPIW